MHTENKVSTTIFRTKEEIFQEELSPIYQGDEFYNGDMKYPHSEEYCFNPYGTSSLKIPSFFFDNLQKVAKNCQTRDLQFPEFGGRRDLKESFLSNFPDVNKYFKDLNLSIENILVSNGDLRGISSCIEAFCGHYDELIVFEPVHPLQLSRTILRRDILVKPVGMIYDSKTDRFEIDFESLKKALSPKVKLMIITNPNNPTTRVFTKEDFVKISQLLKNYPNVKVLEDRAYFGVYAEGLDPLPYCCACPEDFDRSIITYSMGKFLNANGVRVGFILSSKENIKHIVKIFPADIQFTPQIDQMLIRENLFSCLNKYIGNTDYYHFFRNDLIDRVSNVKKELTFCGIKSIKWEGTYYLIIDIENLRGKLPLSYFRDNDNRPIEELDRAFCRGLFKDCKIGLIPLSNHFFGNVVYDNFVRIPINRNDEDLKFFCDNLKSLIRDKIQ